MKNKLIVFVLMLGFCFNLKAFTFATEEGLHFPTNDIRVDIATSPCQNAGFSASELQGLVEEANEMYWNKTSMSGLELKTGDTINADYTDVERCNDPQDNDPDCLHNVVPTIESDRILIFCNRELFTDNPTSSLGLGGISCPSGKGSSCKGYVIINAHEDTSFPDFSRLEILTVIGHEIGHALGLGHTEVEEALMYFSISNKSQERLHIDDKMGISYLYPQDKKAAGLLGACGTIALVNNNEPPKGGGSGTGVLAFSLIFILGTLIALFMNGQKMILRLGRLH